MPEQLSVVQLREGLEPLILPVSAQLEHLLHLQLVLSVRGPMSVADVLYQSLELLAVVRQHLGGGGGAE